MMASVGPISRGGSLRHDRNGQGVKHAPSKAKRRRDCTSNVRSAQAATNGGRRIVQQMTHRITKALARLQRDSHDRCCLCGKTFSKGDTAHNGYDEDGHPLRVGDCCHVCRALESSDTVNAEQRALSAFSRPHTCGHPNSDKSPPRHESRSDGGFRGQTSEGANRLSIDNNGGP